MKLLKSTAVVSFFTFLSRISGLARDWLMLRLFGASIWTDAFLVAFRIPNYMRRLFAEGSFALAFVPSLNEIKATQSKAYLRQFINHVFGCLLAVLLVVLALFEIFAPEVLSVFAPGLKARPDDVFSVTVGMLRLTLPYLLLISLVAFCGGILNSFQRFAIPAMSPILLNLSLICAMLFFRNQFAVPQQSLAWGVLIAGIVQLLWQIPALWRLGLLPKPVVNFADAEVKKVIKLMVPTLFGSSVAQLNLLVDTFIATLLPLVGSVTFLYAADRLMEFPLGVFGIAISTVILPRLSFAFAKQSSSDYQQTLSWATGLALLIVLPCAVGLAILAMPILVTLFVYGDFTVEQAMFSSYPLQVYMLGLPAFVINKVLLTAYYSRKDTTTPVKIAVKMLLLNVILNFMFVAILWYCKVTALHVGLALAGVSSAWVQCWLLYRGLRQAKVIGNDLLDRTLLRKILLALLLMAATLWLFSHYFVSWVSWLWYQRLTALLMIIVVSGLIYGLSLLVLGVRKNRLWIS